MVIYIKMEDIEDDPLIAIQDRAGFLFNCVSGICMFGSNFLAKSFIPQKKIFLKDTIPLFFLGFK